MLKHFKIFFILVFTLVQLTQITAQQTESQTAKAQAKTLNRLMRLK